MTGPRFIELWRQTFDYLTTDHGLNNLLWFWTPTVGAGMSPQNTAGYYPGSNYVDFIGVSNYRGTTWDGADDQADIEYYALSIDPTKTFLIAEGFAHANDEPPNWPNHTELGALDIADIRDQLLNDWPFVAGFMFWDRVKAPIYYPNPSALWNDPLVYNLSGTPDYDVENPNVLTDISFLGNFESGSIQPRDEAVDGFSIDVLSLDGTSKKVFDNGGLDADQSWGYDCYCTFGETPPDTPEGGSASFVSPRQGTTFFRQTLWRDKDYKPMNNESDDKPRIHLNTSWYVPFDGQSSDAKNTLRYNREYYIGFSIYLPENFEVDRTGKRTQVIQCQPKTWSITYRLQIVGNRAIPGVGSDYGDRWSIGYTRNEGHMEDFYTPAVTHNFDLGSIYDDLGKWTDFVIRYRHNPNMGPDDLDCSPISRRITGNAVTAYGADIILPPNEGIFQVWKTSGPVDINGNREFFGPYCDVTNSGVGCVPDGSFKRDDEDFTRPSPDGAWTSYRIYPGSWKRDPVSTNYGPRYVGWDEIRHGEVIRDGTTFESVNPGGLVQPTRPWLVGQLGTTQTSLQEAWENMVGHETVMYGKLIPDYILNSWSKWEGFYTAGTLDTFATWFQSRGMRDILLYCGYAMLPKITDTPGSSTNTDNDGLRDPTVWDRAASGVWDSHVHSLGQSIRQQLTDWGRDPEGYNFIMCLGHEMSGTWYSFSVGNKKSEYHETWNRWTSILKSYCPLMKFEWRPAKNKGKNDDGSTATFMEYMPQRNVDVVSLSHHDLTVYKTATNNYNFGNPQYADPAFPQRWRDHHVNGSSNPGQYCLNDLATAGRTLNKPIALGESRPQIGDCQTNWWTASPYPDAFIEYTYNWIESVKDIFWYELYLNSDCSRLDRTNWSAFEPDSGTSKAVLDPNLNIQDNYNRFRAKYLELYVPQLAKIDAAPSRLYENRPITDAK
jgi:hypothetical protein